VGSLAELIGKRWHFREFNDASGVTRLADHVFHTGGRPLGDFRKAWQSACVAAGLGFRDTEGRYHGKLFHDFRRTAARDLIRSGVPETVAMSITGHKTRAMFDRYNITSTSDQREALEKTEAHRVTLGTARSVALFSVKAQPGTRRPRGLEG
jgi:integrase